jgi:hypothetical protein
VNRGLASAAAAALLAFALTIAYAAIVQPDWEPQANDQQQYLSLARGLVDRGQFTRALGDEPFIAETYRLPGYPLFLAPLCVGGCDHWRIAIAQGLLLAVMVLAVHGLARRVTPDHAPLAAVLVALYAPFAYYAALALSDVAAAALLCLGIALWVRALQTRSILWALAAGALLGWAGLMRAALLLLPIALGALAVFRDRRGTRLALACIASAAIVVSPYVAYSQGASGRPFGGTSGLVLWLGVLQGRGEAGLDPVERAQVDAARAEIAAFDAIADRAERAKAWLVLDAALASRARTLVAHDPAGYVVRGLGRSVELWAGDRPVRGGALAGDLAVASGAIQLVVAAIGMIGAIRLARRGGLIGPIAALVIAYVWLSALPFQTEGRYALPARAFVLLGVVAMVEATARRRDATARSAPP